MDTMQDQYGFDALFVREVPDYLKCILCQLVLRNPVQILKCGHKFCEPCFGRLESYAESMNVQLLCPVDRDVIDVTNVFEDKGMERIVGSLPVKCDNSEAGCLWEGELRDVKIHEGKCQHRVATTSFDQAPSKGSDEVAALLKELRQRLGNCEETLLKKEMDIAFLKYDLHDLKGKFNGQVAEMDLLKNRNTDIERELKQLQNKDQDVKQLLCQVENVSLKNTLLDQKVESLQNQLLLATKKMEEKDNLDLVTTAKDEVGGNTGEQLKSRTAKAIKPLKIKNNDDLKKHQEFVYKSLTEQSDKINELYSRLHNTEKDIESRCRKLNKNGRLDETSKQDDTQNKIELIKYHITNIENILFCDSSSGSKDIVLQWKLNNYLYHFDVGKEVYSPVFLTQLNGYRFQLIVDWRGKKKENLGIHLRLSRASDYGKPLEPYNTPFTFHIQDVDGSLLSESVTLGDIRANRKECFTIPRGRSQSDKSYGLSMFLPMPDLERYIVNDMISIKCTLTPPVTLHESSLVLKKPMATAPNLYS